MEALGTSPGALHARHRLARNRDAGCVAYLVAIAGRYEMRHIQFNERGAFGALQWPGKIVVLVPIRQPGDKVRLRGPDDAIVHDSMISQTLQEHVVESRGSNDLADGKSGKTAEQFSLSCVPALTQQEFCVVGKS